MKLPPLPVPAVFIPDRYHGDEVAFDEGQMLAYGRACAAAERERCAKVCDKIEDDVGNEYGSYPEKQAFIDGKTISAGKCAAAIRALKENDE